jgi:hypothetical protein
MAALYAQAAAVLLVACVLIDHIAGCGGFGGDP